MAIPSSSPQVIPLQPSIPWYRMTVTISDAPYILDVRWNARAAAWYFDIYEADETVIQYGLKIVLGTFIGRKVKHPLFEQGAFVAKELSGSGLDAGFDDLGVRVQLRYYTPYDIIAAVQAGNGQG